ncbi:MAG TPA: hypothetical protein VGK20_13955 [Candidatus Binatia bacterium]|jgi:hypothetical protein
MLLLRICALASLAALAAASCSTHPRSLPAAAARPAGGFSIAAASGIEVRGPTLVLFLPGFTLTQANADEKIAALVDQMNAAASELVECLGARGVVLRSVQSDSITLVVDGKPVDEKLQTNESGDYGCVLAMPGKAPIIARPEGGAAAVSAVCAGAASLYFGIPHCEAASPES